MSEYQYDYVSEQCRYPMVKSVADMERIPASNAKQFCFCLSYHPRVLELATSLGVFPMSINIQGYELPAYKLHKRRCVLRGGGGGVHVHKKTIQRAKRFGFYLNRDSDALARAVQLLQREHENNWLCPMLARALQFIAERSDEFGMRVCVWEVYEGDRLVAVEVGYVVGRIYTSMTGAYEKDVSGAGSVQLAITSRYLQKHGFAIWDFGMAMEYKTDMGAIEVPRAEWVEMVRRGAGALKTPSMVATHHANCRTYLKWEEFINEVD